MKFFNLFKKELKEMLTVQTIVTMILLVAVLCVAGNALSSSIDESTESSKNITICDKDNTEFTKYLLSEMKKQIKDSGGNFKSVDVESDNYADEMKKLDIKNVVIIPKGFTETVQNHKVAKVKYIEKMTSLATMANLSTGSDAALQFIEANVKSAIYDNKVSQGSMTTEEVTQLENPVELDETTVVADKWENISGTIITSLCSMQGMLVPIIMFILIMYSSQMILGAVSTEKIDKTLETLLSAPVSRLSVVSAKMLSAGVVAALQAIVYMFGMNRMMSGITDNMGDTSAYNKAMENLGLTLSTSQYILVGIQMFLSILIALSISLILGVLAKDSKSAQTLVMPINFAAMIPYFLTMFVDVKTVTPVLKYIVYAIPFSHSFMASENVMFHNNTLYVGGLIYQIVFLIVCMTIALKIFMSDRIFTMSLGGKKQRSASKKSLFTRAK